MTKIIVLRNGIVGFKFCEKFISKSGQEKYQITVFGDGPTRAHDS